MKRFKFCTISSDEHIAITKAENVDKATEFFAVSKNLGVDQFLTIYRVVEIDEKQK
jgi:hypothetical protein